MKQQKGYCAVTRTTHICSWTEKKKKKKVRREQLDMSGRNGAGGGTREVLWQREGWIERGRNAEKIQRNKERWRETEKRRDGAIYGRLVVMVISRRERRG